MNREFGKKHPGHLETIVFSIRPWLAYFLRPTGRL